MKKMQEDLKLNSFENVYLLYGNEGFLKKTWKNRLLAAMIPEGDTMNITKYEGKGINLEEVYDLSQTLPFFADRRLILLENTELFAPSKGGGKASNTKKKNTPSEDLIEMVTALPETTCLVMVEEKVDKRGRAFKEVSKCGYAAELNTQDADTLVTWLLRTAKELGKEIDKRTASMLLEYCGMDMMSLYNEMEKLVSYTGERNQISVADVEAVCIGQVTGKIFEMMDAITLRQPERTITLYRDLMMLREAPLKILNLITRQIRILVELKGLLQDNVEYGKLASVLGVPPFAVKKYVSQCKAYSYSELLAMFEQCQQTEMQIKSGQIGDVIGVELLIVGFSKK